MLQKEFEERTGITGEEEYNKANAVYESCFGFEKDEFCAIWKKTDEDTRRLMEDIVATMQARVNDANEKLHKITTDSTKQLKEMTEALNSAEAELKKLNDEDRVLAIPIQDYATSLQLMCSRSDIRRVISDLNQRIIELSGMAAEKPELSTQYLHRIKELFYLKEKYVEEEKMWDGKVEKFYCGKEK